MNKGILYILLSGLCFMIVNIFVKILALGDQQPFFQNLQSYPVHEIILFRSVITFIMCYAIIRQKRIPFFGYNHKWLVIRGVFGTAALTLFFYTLGALPIAIATTVQYLSPIFTVLIATYLLKEKVNKVQWIFFLLAFFGVIGISLSKFLSEDVKTAYIQPFWVLMGVLSAALSGVSYNAIVKCKNTDEPVTIVMYFPLIAIPIMTVFSFYEFVVPKGVEWLILLIIGVFTQFAQILMTKALHAENTATVTPFKYFGSIYAFFIGFFLFDEIISMVGILGIIFILTGVLGNTYFRVRKYRNT
ncbi:MAG: DMT family transporter [Crocinitomicaceae bacterium]|nr:DMT family transporter [Crocinitomicaceae bacterium]